MCFAHTELRIVSFHNDWNLLVLPIMFCDNVFIVFPPFFQAFTSFTSRLIIIIIIIINTIQKIQR